MHLNANVVSVYRALYLIHSFAKVSGFVFFNLFFFRLSHTPVSFTSAEIFFFFFFFLVFFFKSLVSAAEVVSTERGKVQSPGINEEQAKLLPRKEFAASRPR